MKEVQRKRKEEKGRKQKEDNKLRNEKEITRKQWAPRVRVSPKNLPGHIEPELGQLTPT